MNLQSVSTGPDRLDRMDWIGRFFIGRFLKTGSWRNTGISEKTGYQKKKKKLIDIGLRTAFGGYWKLFMDGKSLDIGLLRLLIPVNQLEPKV
jgi:hypothetical protein